MVDTKWILIQTGRERDFSRVKNAVESFGREATVVTLKQVYEGTSLPESTNSVVYGPSCGVRDSDLWMALLAELA